MTHGLEEVHKVKCGVSLLVGAVGGREKKEKIEKKGDKASRVELREKKGMKTK